MWTEVGKLWICSNHFEGDHITESCSTRTFLKKSAYPRLVNGIAIFKVDDFLQLQLDYEAEVSLNFSTYPTTPLPEDDQEVGCSTEDRNEQLEAENANLYQKLAESEEELRKCRDELRKLKQKVKRFEEQRKRKRSKSPPPSPPPKKMCICQSKLEEGHIANEIFARIQKGYVNAPYSEELKDFSFQLHYYSPRAYLFLREKLDVLPHPRTFHRWTEGIDTSPGFLSHSISFMKRIHSESAHNIYYNLAVDEIYIRKQIIHDGDGFVGFTDYGGIVENDEDPSEATCALFIMATAINASHRVPLGYILTNGLKANVLAEVIRKSLQVVKETNGKVLSVTFDGLRSNLQAMKLLGANLDITSDEFKPYFIDPFTNELVYVILDVCHMMKLLRNLFKAYGVIWNSTEDKIKWVFVDRLHKLQQKTGLKAANKLSARHVNFAQQKMKTKLSLQIFSNSVSVALEVCRKLDLDGFHDSQATEEFLSNMNKLFDILNSRAGGKFEKSPINERNSAEILDTFKLMKTYLMALTVNEKGQRKLLINSQKSTAARGLITTISSLEMITSTIVGQCDLKYLPTYKLSQDKIELFFSVLRSRFGFNDNPNVVQLKHALKGILCINAKTVNNGNCYVEEDVMVKVCPFGKLATLTVDADCTLSEEIETSQEDPEPFEDITGFIGNIVAYIAGFVGRKLCATLKCSSCICRLLPDNDEVEELSEDSILLMSKNKGGLFMPSVFLVTICKLSEQVIRQSQVPGLSHIHKENLLNLVGQEFVRNKYGESLKSIEKQCTIDHTMNLVNCISSEFMKIRFHHIARQRTIELKPSNNRASSKNAVKFAGN